MNLCIRPCLVFSAFLLLVAIVFLIFLGDIKGQNTVEYDYSNVGVQLGSVFFGLICLVVTLSMFRSNGFFIFGSSNQYLFLILFTLLLFSFFAISFMISNVWAQDRWLNMGLFLALDVLQCAFVGLSLFVQKSRFDDWILKTMQLNTKAGNPIDSRTASRLYKMRHARKNGTRPMFDNHEVERLSSYLVPKDEDLKQSNETDIISTNKNEGLYYCAAAAVV
ncbi:hypothetical protein M3Y97_00616100 [Aphelenchoides bicaudatus]|nr:hypothetical protein M3Y97_00616100 [Aphelenchoides bicaudatus]